MQHRVYIKFCCCKLFVVKAKYFFRLRYSWLLRLETNMWLLWCRIRVLLRLETNMSLLRCRIRVLLRLETNMSLLRYRIRVLLRLETYMSFAVKDWVRISVGLSEHLYAPEIVSRLNQPGVASIRRWWPWILAAKQLKNCLDLWCSCSYAYHLFLMSTICAQLSP